MESQAEFEFNGSKIRVCYEEGLVFISLGVVPLSLSYFYVLTGVSAVWVTWVYWARGNWFMISDALYPC